jgi:hypothetical protein
VYDGIRVVRGHEAPTRMPTCAGFLRAGLALVLLTGIAMGQRAESADFEVPASSLSWASAVPDRLDPDKALPWPGGDHPDALLGRVERLLAVRWKKGEAAGEESSGDLLASLLAVRADGDALDAALARVAERAPDVFGEWGDLVSDLVRDRALRGGDWLPSRGSRDDGFHVGPPLQLGKEPMPSWRRVRGSQAVQQAATLIVADLVALELAENDYRNYLQQIGTTYEAIAPVEGSLLRSPPETEPPYAALRVAFVCDLPFPFSNYRCDLQILKRLRGDGLLQTDTWSDSRDFLWIAGSNVYLPVETSDGRFVGMIAVRTFGFDLRGVPDGDSDRLAGLRGVLGNLKREAESRFVGRPEDRELLLRGVIPTVPVLGRRS